MSDLELVNTSDANSVLYAGIGLAYNAAMLEKGLVQIYTGDGKGKTTAAFGLALRAAGQGNKVLIYQFLKPPNLDVGERFALQLGAVRIRVEALDVPWDMSASRVDEKAVGQMQAAIAEVLEKITETAQKRFYDVLILDEIVFCLSEGLASLDAVKALIDGRDPGVEIVLTGRGATDELIALADLVTEMKNLKHPLDEGLRARRGIEY
ncbi:MAG: cob(I)yrinic acid a,c-diamide adenosyltransferase [Phycisphaerales bacterium]|nr:MAG: cob(I)yrinic acid a,c-diamide adenosyltransferase [Phycisphaerales bacterium]